jgi:hypothetical protein
VPERFRRTLGGFDPQQVRAAIEERDQRLERLERRADLLARRVAAAEGRAVEDVDADVDGDEVAEGAIVGLGRRLEEIHEQARRQATRIRMGALQDAVQVSERVAELTKLRDELSARVTEMAGKAGIRLGDEERAAVGTEAARTAVDGTYSGAVEVEVGPLRDFAQLTSFEDAVSTIEAGSEVKVSGFSGGRATFSMRFAQPVELVRELEQRSPFGFSVRDATAEGVVLDLDSDAA